MIRVVEKSITAIAALWLAGIAIEATASTLEKGETIYEQRCAVCHDSPQEHIPPRQLLTSRTQKYIVEKLTHGSMQLQAFGLSALDINAVADYLTAPLVNAIKAGQPAVTQEPNPHANQCKHPASPLRFGPGQWNGWSPDMTNGRFQIQPGFRATDVPRLKPKWVFAYPDMSVFGPPSVVGNRVFIGTRSGQVFSLDAETGCTWWVTRPGPYVKTSVVVGAWPKSVQVKDHQPAYAAYFGDANAVVHAVDAESGKTLWSTKVDDHQLAYISGSLTLYKGRLYVPVASGEGMMASQGSYSCCTLRGSLVVLDSVTGKIIWKSYTIAEQPKPFKLNSAGTQMYGPAGASIWSPPTADVQGGVVYGTTGQSRTDVNTDASDAVIAFDLETGVRRWLMQATVGDNFNPGCAVARPGPNCPDPLGPDADFGSPAILHTLANGKRILMAGQKSGMVHALDPDAHGKHVWQVDLAKDADVPPGVVLRDRAQPGVVFGMAADTEKLYVAIADPGSKKGHIPLGVYALDIATGDVVWHTPGETVPSCSWGAKGCTGAQRTAVTVTPGVVFAGSANGHMHAYDAIDGTIIWDFDTAKSFPAVNGVDAHGGSIEGSATAIANGALYVMSGYGSYGGGIGNALIAFTVDGK